MRTSGDEIINAVKLFVFNLVGKIEDLDLDLAINAPDRIGTIALCLSNSKPISPGKSSMRTRLRAGSKYWLCLSGFSWVVI